MQDGDEKPERRRERLRQKEIKIAKSERIPLKIAAIKAKPEISYTAAYITPANILSNTITLK
ncbi:MAG: hypothetical protein ACQEWV_29550 [Bacillota bacterium]